ncbi:uncharacterized protein LOC125068321 [Vanessa atalanta]|uniref:uncharacterized protein LOC125068321 n=1 Tax=Vanessa atalanta TaxID=42275 RepID=UPI001FCD65E7|nr:uncharacterized protein LOC125068321 [Vanessa atalanta]
MMNRVLIVLVAMCMFTVAMVPKNRRALNSEEEKTRRSSTENPTQICAPRTPCGWSVYKPVSKMIELNITNTYCHCGSKAECKVSEDDTGASALILRCKLRADLIETPES